jgi:hypothetical protein
MGIESAFSETDIGLVISSILKIGNCACAVALTLWKIRRIPIDVKTNLLVRRDGYGFMKIEFCRIKI